MRPDGSHGSSSGSPVVRISAFSPRGVTSDADIEAPLIALARQVGHHVAVAQNLVVLRTTGRPLSVER